MSHLDDTVDDYLDNSPDPEDEAINLFHHLRNRFGWSGTFMTRADAEEHAGRSLSDEEWGRVWGSKHWNDMPSMWLEMGAWDGLAFALEAAEVEVKDEDETGDPA